METTKILLSELYTAYFNRAPDADGLAYWEEQVSTGSMDFDAIAQNWANEQPEFVQTYGTNPDPDTLINKVYQNVLGRTPDSDGATYWSNELANGNISTSSLIEAVVAGAGDDVKLSTVVKITLVLGLNFAREEIISLKELEQHRAKEKALFMASLTQGTSALEM